jgi:CheY-like chemotaxis protein
MSILEKKKILIVDDESMLREILRDVLEYEGALVQEAENGKVAMEIYRRDGFDAVVSDIRMPGGDGLELLGSLRKLDCSTPVVMLITGFSDLSHDAAYNLGADAVLSKPFDVNELLARLMFLLSPLSVRLSSAEESGPHSEIRIADGKTVAIGRGGFFIPEHISGVVGDRISFSFDCPEAGGRIEGSGVIRWIRRSPNGTTPSGSGIEFRFLEADSLQRVLEWSRKTSRCAFIPDRIPG